MNPEPAAHARFDPALSPLNRVRPRSVHTWRDEVAKARQRVASQWEAIGRSRAITERNRVLLNECSSV